LPTLGEAERSMGRGEERCFDGQAPPVESSIHPFTPGEGNVRLPTPSQARQLLDVADGASVADVRSAFRASVRRQRPDLGGLSGEATSELVAARDLLVALAEDHIADGVHHGPRSRILRGTDPAPWQPPVLGRRRGDAVVSVYGAGGWRAQRITAVRSGVLNTTL
jgi:hypothetical protein